MAAWKIEQGRTAVKGYLLFTLICIFTLACCITTKAAQPGIEEYEQEVAKEIITAIKTNDHIKLLKYFKPSIGTRISLQRLGDYGTYNDYGGYTEKNGNLYILLFDTERLNTIQRVTNAFSFMDAFNKDDKVSGHFPKASDKYKIAPQIIGLIGNNYYYIILSKQDDGTYKIGAVYIDIRPGL
jgi:hypothetical protein